MADVEILDSQILPENVSFLNNHQNLYPLKTNIYFAKEYLLEQNNKKERKNTSSKIYQNSQNTSLLYTSLTKSTISQVGVHKIVNKNLKSWGLPKEIVSKYEEKGVIEMFEWQVKCLANSKVLFESCNLVYSAPTSAGKTLVAEILTIKTVLERQKKVIIILPFVSIVREKMFYLQDILSSSGIRVEGFMGSHSPPGGLQAVHVAICTIEKANSLINKLLDDGNINELGAIIVDELHLLGDPHRGYILELLLTKIKYVCANSDDVQVQVIGMSATLPNLEILANWLNAELFVTEFRPIPLDEYCLVENTLINKQGLIEKVLPCQTTASSILEICLETIKEGCSVLIFCGTKNRCESLAQSIAKSLYNIGCEQSENSTVLRNQLNSETIAEVLEQLKNCPVGLDEILKNTISFGVAYHHAGLTFDERDIIEGAFKSGAIRVLIATSTLSSGVNLPARRVIIRTPYFLKNPINTLTYKQMIGRAGRMGKDTKGESILICEKGQKNIGLKIMTGTLDPVNSCIGSQEKYMRVVLEIIASQVTCTINGLEKYAKCTLLHSQNNNMNNSLLYDVLKKLIASELVRIQRDDRNDRNVYYVATSLGKACLSASMGPDDGLSLFFELQRSRQCLVLENDLHLIYLVTPYSVSDQWGAIDWLHFSSLWESSTKATKKIGELLGVKESLIMNCVRHQMNSPRIFIYRRFYTALALQDLVNEVPLSEVAAKFQRPRGFLQSLQQAAATFAGMVTAFCNQLGWKNLEILISQFQDRLHFGVNSELLDLMKLPSLNGVRARALFDSGFETVSSIASAEVNVIENVLYKAVPFQSEKEREDDDTDDVRKRNKLKSIWITGCCGMTVKEAAQNLIIEARKHVEAQIGVTEIKWENKTKNSIQNPEDIVNNDANDESVQIKEEIFDDKQVQNTDNSESIHKPTRISENILNSSIENIKYDKINESQTEIQPLLTLDDTLKTNRLSENFLDDSCEDITQDKTSKEIDTFINLNTKVNQSTPVLVESPQLMNSAINIKDEIMWDSLEFTETAIQNITKYPNNIKNSPVITFEGTDKSLTDNNIGTSKNLNRQSTSVKDVSLFSTDGDNSSLFEESLPLHLLPSIIQNATSPVSVAMVKKETTSDFVNINSESMLQAFKSPIVFSENSSQSKFINENEVLCSQDTMFIHSFKSPNKRALEDKSHEVTDVKKQRIESSENSVEICKPSSSNAVEVGNKTPTIKIIKFQNYTIRCVFVNEISIYYDLKVKNIETAAVFIVLNEKVSTKVKIGGNILDEIPKLDNQDGSIKGIALFVGDDTCYYLDMTTLLCEIDLLKERRKTWFLNGKVTLKACSLSSHFVSFKEWLGADSIPPYYDVALVERFLFGKEKEPQGSSLFCMLQKYCGISISIMPMKIDNTIKMFKNLDDKMNACIKAWCIWQIAQKQQLLPEYKLLSPNNVLKTEHRTSVILAACEEYGIEIDRDYATGIWTKVKESIDILQKKADKLAGYHVNMSSPTSVAKALKLDQRGKAKSTNKTVLSCHSSPLASVVLYWRKLEHALTHTLYPLIEESANYSEIDRVNTSIATGRIYPKYTMDTQTGRISMHEPNLQNVPRTFTVPSKYLSGLHDVEFNIRHAFRASPGWVMVSADYCQLEMRVLTHFSEDRVLMDIMYSNTDVFKSIAASWSGVPEDQVDDDLRQKAKQLCYGILYGMGNATLARNLDVTELEAASFIHQFYSKFSDVNKYKVLVSEKCRKDGFVETLMKRRRFIGKSGVPFLQKSSERQALNTTIQGSAADIAKAAMCGIDTKIKSMDPKPRLLLQMHDELIYEVHESKKNEFIKIMKQSMEGTIKLKVPLPVRVRSGHTWGTLQDDN